jgi:acetate kinase
LEVVTMKKVLVLNFGSSGLKWSLLDARNEDLLEGGQEKLPLSGPFPMEALLRRLPKPDAVGHRIVHGGTFFQQAVRIDQDIRAKLESLVELAPSHMRAALAAVDRINMDWAGVPQFAFFDTAFHASLSEAAAGYALPREWVKKWGLRRFGFHGLSVAYATARAAQWMGKIHHRLVVCHLGSGCSVTAVENGKSVDTTMGYTPLEGLVMATRSGSIDPGLLLSLQLHQGVKPEELAETLIHRSGLLGVSGISGDIREVWAAAEKGSAPAALAYGQFVQSARRAIGAMIAVLGGVDALVFTGGIGENQLQVRQDLTSTLAYAGVLLDGDFNRSVVPDQDIATNESKARVFVFKAREDLTILRELLQISSMA